MKAFKVLGRSLRDFLRDDGVHHAASMSFFFIVTIVPLCLFVLTVFGYMLGENEEFYAFFAAKLVGLFPRITKGIVGELRNLIAYKGIGVMGMVLYAIMASQFYRSVDKSLQSVFKVYERRPPLRAFLLALAVSTLVLGLLFLSFLLSSGVTVFKALEDQYPRLGIGTVRAIFLKYVIPLFLVQSVSTTLYILLPYRKVSLRSALWGGLFTAVMLEAAKHLFTWYVGVMRNIGTLYGSLSAFVVFLLWVYYSSAIFLLGGEIVHDLTPDKRLTPARRATDKADKTD